MTSDPNQLWEQTFTPFPAFSDLPPLGNGLAPVGTNSATPDYIGQAVKNAPTIFGTYGGPVETPAFGSDIPGDAAKTVGSAVWWIGGRYITIAVGLIFILGGIYLLGTSQVQSAIKKAVIP
jgi:hypothetical protein